MTASVPTVQDQPAVSPLALGGSTVSAARLAGGLRSGLAAIVGAAADLVVTAALAGLDDGDGTARPANTAVVAGRPDPRITRSLTFPAHRG